MTDPAELWVAAVTLSKVTGRKYRTIQRWARLGQVRSRTNAGALEIVFSDFAREHGRAARRNRVGS